VARDSQDALDRPAHLFNPVHRPSRIARVAPLDRQDNPEARDPQDNQEIQVDQDNPVKAVDKARLDLLDRKDHRDNPVSPVDQDSQETPVLQEPRHQACLAQRDPLVLLDSQETPDSQEAPDSLEDRVRQVPRAHKEIRDGLDNPVAPASQEALDSPEKTRPIALVQPELGPLQLQLQPHLLRNRSKTHPLRATSESPPSEHKPKWSAKTKRRKINYAENKTSKTLPKKRQTLDYHDRICAPFFYIFLCIAFVENEQKQEFNE